MVAIRCFAALLTALSTTFALSSCSTPKQDPATTAPESTSVSPSGHASGDLNLSRLGELRDAFPPGLTPEPPSGPTKVAPQWAHLVGDTVSSGKPFTVDPPECRPLFKPVEAQGGADNMGIGAGGPQWPALVVNVVDPVAVPVPLPSRGCHRVTFQVQGAIPDGTAERLAAPNIDGATTYGLKILYNAGVEYFYTAILDGRTYVLVMARMAPDFQAEPLLPDLLIKAVTAIRG